jgi:hypothetical protein
MVRPEAFGLVDMRLFVSLVRPYPALSLYFVYWRHRSISSYALIAGTSPTTPKTWQQLSPASTRAQPIAEGGRRYAVRPAGRCWMQV